MEALPEALLLEQRASFMEDLSRQHLWAYLPQPFCLLWQFFAIAGAMEPWQHLFFVKEIQKSSVSPTRPSATPTSCTWIGHANADRARFFQVHALVEHISPRSTTYSPTAKLKIRPFSKGCCESGTNLIFCTGEEERQILDDSWWLFEMRGVRSAVFDTSSASGCHDHSNSLPMYVAPARRCALVAGGVVLCIPGAQRSSTVPAFRLKKNLLCSLFSHKLKVHVSFGLVIMNRGTQGMNKQVMTASADTESTICSPTLNAADTQNTKICQA